MDKLLKAQESKPFFWIESRLPYCWNDPKHWERDHIVYQWGHLNPRNSLGKAVGSVNDLCLMSARCNNHIQSSLPLADLREYFHGCQVGDRIEVVISRRDELFESEEWKLLIKELSSYKRLPS